MVAALIGRLANAPSALNAASLSSASNTYEGPAEIGKVATSAPITGPARSVITDADTTNAAVTAMRSSSIRIKASSGGIAVIVILRCPRNARASKDGQQRRPSRLASLAPQGDGA